jgi:hypothetical protein
MAPATVRRHMLGGRCEILKTLTHGADIGEEKFPPSVVPELGGVARGRPVSSDTKETQDHEELPRSAGGAP